MRKLIGFSGRGRSPFFEAGSSLDYSSEELNSSIDKLVSVRGAMRLVCDVAPYFDVIGEGVRLRLTDRVRYLVGKLLTDDPIKASAEAKLAKKITKRLSAKSIAKKGIPTSKKIEIRDALKLLETVIFKAFGRDGVPPKLVDFFVEITLESAGVPMPQSPSHYFKFYSLVSEKESKDVGKAKSRRSFTQYPILKHVVLTRVSDMVLGQQAGSVDTVTSYSEVVKFRGLIFDALIAPAFGPESRDQFIYNLDGDGIKRVIDIATFRQSALSACSDLRLLSNALIRTASIHDIIVTAKRKIASLLSDRFNLLTQIPKVAQLKEWASRSELDFNVNDEMTQIVSLLVQLEPTESALPDYQNFLTESRPMVSKLLRGFLTEPWQYGQSLLKTSRILLDLINLFSSGKGVVPPQKVDRFDALTDGQLMWVLSVLSNALFPIQNVLFLNAVNTLPESPEDRKVALKGIADRFLAKNAPFLVALDLSESKLSEGEMTWTDFEALDNAYPQTWESPEYREGVSKFLDQLKDKVSRHLVTILGQFTLQRKVKGIGYVKPVNTPTRNQVGRVQAFNVFGKIAPLVLLSEQTPHYTDRLNRLIGHINRGIADLQADRSRNLYQLIREVGLIQRLLMELIQAVVTVSKDAPSGRPTGPMADLQTQAYAVDRCLTDGLLQAMPMGNIPGDVTASDLLPHTRLSDQVEVSDTRRFDPNRQNGNMIHLAQAITEFVRSEETYVATFDAAAAVFDFGVPQEHSDSRWDFARGVGKHFREKVGVFLDGLSEVYQARHAALADPEALEEGVTQEMGRFRQRLLYSSTQVTMALQLLALRLEGFHSFEPLNTVADVIAVIKAQQVTLAEDSQAWIGQQPSFQPVLAAFQSFYEDCLTVFESIESLDLAERQKVVARLVAQSKRLNTSNLGFTRWVSSQFLSDFIGYLDTCFTPQLLFLAMGRYTFETADSVLNENAAIGQYIRSNQSLLPLESVSALKQMDFNPFNGLMQRLPRYQLLLETIQTHAALPHIDEAVLLDLFKLIERLKRVAFLVETLSRGTEV